MTKGGHTGFCFNVMSYSLLSILLILVSLLSGLLTLFLFYSGRKRKELAIRLAEQEATVTNAVEEKKALVRIVSHDLNAPFNRVYALVSLIRLKEDNLSDDQQNYLSKMQQVVKDGMGLIRNLLDARSIEGKGVPMDIKEFDLVNHINGLLKSQRIIAAIKGTTIELECSEEEIIITSEKQYITRILENLISNALKFAKSNRMIHVQLSSSADAVLIEVKDQGPGISEGDQQQLYEKHVTLSAQSTDGESATGLGLYVTKSLVGRLNGRIFCESELSKGSSFFVELPKVMPES